MRLFSVAQAGRLREHAVGVFGSLRGVATRAKNLALAGLDAVPRRLLTILTVLLDLHVDEALPKGQANAPLFGGFGLDGIARLTTWRLIRLVGRRARFLVQTPVTLLARDGAVPDVVAWTPILRRTVTALADFHILVEVEGYKCRRIQDDRRGQYMFKEIAVVELYKK